MIELWSKEQMLAELSKDDFEELWKQISESCQGVSYSNAVGKFFGKWTVRQINVMPAESVSLILEHKSQGLIMKVVADAISITRTQVFFQRRMVPVEEYVEAKDLKSGIGAISY